SPDHPMHAHASSKPTRNRHVLAAKPHLILLFPFGSFAPFVAEASTCEHLRKRDRLTASRSRRDSHRRLPEPPPWPRLPLSPRTEPKPRAPDPSPRAGPRPLPPRAFDPPEPLDPREP